MTGRSPLPSRILIPVANPMTAEELIRLAAMGSRFRKLDRKVLHDSIRLLTGSAADFLDDYFDSDLLKGYRAAFINPSSKLLGPKFKFAKHGQSGAEISELLPNIAGPMWDDYRARNA